MRKMLLLPVALLTLTAAACKHTEPGVQTIEVEVPVPQPCLTADELAELPEPPLVGDQLGRTPETAAQDRDILAGSALRLRAWGRTLYAAHQACSDGSQEPS